MADRWDRERSYDRERDYDREHDRGWGQRDRDYDRWSTGSGDRERDWNREREWDRSDMERDRERGWGMRGYNPEQDRGRTRGWVRGGDWDRDDRSWGERRQEPYGDRGWNDRTRGDERPQARTYAGGFEDRDRYRSWEDRNREREQSRQGEGDRGWLDRAVDSVKDFFTTEEQERGRDWDADRSRGYGGGMMSGGRAAGASAAGAFAAGTQAGRYAGRGPKNYQRSDERITEEVCERLTRHPDVDATEIDVRVEKGVVSLGGSVEDRHTKRAAEDAVWGIWGVKEVNNDIRVRQREYSTAGTTTGTADSSSITGTTQTGSTIPGGTGNVDKR